MLHFLFVCAVFFLLKRDRNTNYKCDSQDNLNTYKMMFVSVTQVKNCGRRCIFSGESDIFQGSGKNISKDNIHNV